MNLADRIQETTTTAGTGNITTSGTAATNCKTFSFSYPIGTAFIPYAIVHQTVAEWEVGFGTYSALNTFIRVMPLRNSAGTARTLLNFSAGTKDIFVDIPADMITDMYSRGQTEQMRLGAFSI